MSSQHRFYPTTAVVDSHASTPNHAPHSCVNIGGGGGKPSQGGDDVLREPRAVRGQRRGGQRDGRHDRQAGGGGQGRGEDALRARQVRLFYLFASCPQLRARNEGSPLGVEGFSSCPQSKARNKWQPVRVESFLFLPPVRSSQQQCQPCKHGGASSPFL